MSRIYVVLIALYSYDAENNEKKSYIAPVLFLLLACLAAPPPHS